MHSSTPLLFLILGLIVLASLVFAAIVISGAMVFSESTTIDPVDGDVLAEDAVAENATLVKASARVVLAREDVLVIAHRGASRHAPENTLLAFQAALDAGADLVELDYRQSQDGELVVLHDKTLDRTTDARAQWGGRDLAVSEQPLARLRTLDAGTWFGSRFAGTRLPTLAQALDVIQSGSITLIERKAGAAAALVALLRSKDLLEQVIVQAFDWDFLADLRELEPRCAIVALGSKKLTAQRLDRLTGMGARAIGWNKRDVTAALVQAAHERGLKVWVYTVDNDERARALVALGVDGIITNRPEQVRTALR